MLMAVGHQGVMSEPWCNEMVCPVHPLIASQVAVVVGTSVG